MRYHLCHISISFLNRGEILEAPPRIELGIKVLQTSALPLGYGAIFQTSDRAKGALGADYGGRTRYLNLGKVALYQMS